MKGNQRLRLGITTGSCATAAAKAAARVLLSGEDVHEVHFEAMNGTPLSVEILRLDQRPGLVLCSVRKDAGDDPDVTHGMEVAAEVALAPEGIRFLGGEGVGVVTRPGLKISVGEPAINPIPRKMIEKELRAEAARAHYDGGFTVTVSIPEGAARAKETMNARLGIQGGLSVLGTTGIVEPMSDRAIIETIHLEMDLLYAKGARSLLLTPGNFGKDFVSEELHWPMESLIKCSNYLGETLDYARYLGFRRLTLVGHAGKLVKVAGGIMNTYSKIADGRMEIMAAHAAALGLHGPTVDEVLSAITVDGALEIIERAGIDGDLFWTRIGEKILFHMAHRVREEMDLELVVFSQIYGRLFEGVRPRKGGEAKGL